MSPSPRPLDETRLRSMLRGEPFVRKLILLENTASTTDEVRKLAARGAEQGTVVIAEAQTAGRGRLGRRWHSPRGLGLYLSVLFRPSAPLRELTRWTLSAAVAACEACRQSGSASIEIEWPNDLVWDDRKVGGVLTEMRSTGSKVTDLVIGTGINVRHAVEDFPADLASRATSLELAGGAAPDREELAAVYLRELAEVTRHLENGRWEAVASRWEAMAPGARGRRVQVLGNTGAVEYEGVTAGLDRTGALLVRRNDGREMSVRTAESVLPLDGRARCC